MKVKAMLWALLVVVLATGYSDANKITSCHSCSGINCQRTGVSLVQKCVDSLDYCVTIYENSKVLYKGCSLEIPAKLRHRCDSPHDDSCFKCNSDNCNNVGSMRFACVQCDSSKDANCAENATSLRPTVCTAPTAPNSYCYVKASGSGSNIQRGCSTTVTDQQSCLQDANCLLCSSGDIRACNSLNITFDSNAGNRFIRFLR
ncbi:hypothetical protein AWZ03_010854 [Drosophila navojoa]|uniref:DUF753 domain-containing protein n=1 Tax=Drosophila navojoa TaxID=7232 RepID=A0A484B1P2_DRONA|nr:uncharacterized protein LOC115563923 [Drosophila navojoa]TDG42716.1 hypothetical protein AWZ03_010854 [Drosophila navojoa]